MKKLALVLGSLLVVGTAASAKEVVPAPVVVPEKVVEVVEKPVIVYRDREVEQGWRPNGSVDVQYRYYGETENKISGEDDAPKGKTASWARDKYEYGRLQTLTNINFTEKQNLEIRTRNFQTLRNGKDSANGMARSVAPVDELRLRHHYNFGEVANSKVTAKSRLEYLQKGGDGEKQLAASVAFDFANYFFSNDYFKVDKFAVRPIYVHSWKNHGNDDTVNKYGLNLETEYSLPFGFSVEFNVKSGYARKADGYFYTENNGKHRGNYYADLELYLYNTTNLYKDGNFAVDFVFEGGYDPYTFNQRRILNIAQADDTDTKAGTLAEGERAQRREYTLYALPALRATYKPTDFVTLYAAAGAQYQNWNRTVESNANGWRWQPTAWAGAKVSF